MKTTDRRSQKLNRIQWNPAAAGNQVDFAALLTRQGVRRKLLVQRLKARLWRIALRAYLTTVAVPTLGAALG